MFEHTVQTIKKTLKKAHEAIEDVYLALLALNSTPSQDGTSPAYKFFNRQICTTLPSANVQVKTCNIQKRKTIRHKHVRQLPEIPNGSTVRICTNKDKSWSEMRKVVSKHPNPRSYNILNSAGNVVRCNHRHLIPTKEPFHVTEEYSQPLCSEGTSNQVQDQTTPQSEPPPSPALPPGPLPVTQPSTMETKTTRSGRIVKQPRRYADYHMDKK